MSDGEVTVYEAVGGQGFFDSLVERFYARVAADAVLRPVYPEAEEDFAASAHRLALFLGQYWGGPTAYSQARGHPRLRMRHAGFAVGRRERDAWYAAMAASVREAEVSDAIGARLLEYFATASDHMINSF